MNILVTGGGGFIGSHLVDHLLESGNKVWVLDNFSTGHRSNLPSSNPSLTIVEGDIRDVQIVDSVMSKVTAVVHLAAVASVQASIEDPLGTHQVNLVGTLNLLEAARKYSVKRFVFASSAAVYGDVQTLPVTEDISLAPLTPYAADKLASEYYLDFYRRQYGLKPVVFRFFNIFGPRQDPSSPYSGVISIFMERAINDLPITVFGDGRQSRDFVYVVDLVTVLTRAVESEQDFSQPMNVGNGQETNLNHLLELICGFSGKSLDVTYDAFRPGDIRHSLADNNRLQQQFAYEKQYSLEAGLKITFDWYVRKNLHS